MGNIDKAKSRLKKYNQQTVLNILEKLEPNLQEKLASQILETDFDKLLELYNNRNKKSIANDIIEPIEFIDKNKLSQLEKQSLSQKGEDIIKNHQYAVVTMAGGQGTRLGHNGPKGTFKLDIGPNGKYIFEILVDTLKAANKQYNTDIPWYIMTSTQNYQDTINFFNEHHYFGYNQNNIKFFIQEEIEMLSENGDILIDENFNIKKASNGNGGIYQALQHSGMISDMKNNNIKWIYICGVDNIAVNMVDSLFLGLTIDKKVPSASKSVKKSYPEENVGIFCKKNKKPSIIEYIDMTKDMIYSQNNDGELLYGESNILSHLFNIESLENLANYNLIYHCAHKKATYINENLEKIIPQEANSYKFETFIFDAFEFLDDMIIMRVNREDEFAPIKNFRGVDSPETAKVIYENKLLKNLPN